VAPAGLAAHRPTAHAARQLDAWVCQRTQARGHHDRGRCSGAGGTGSLFDEVQLGVRDEHPCGEGHLLGSVRERAAHRDGGAT
jgi:hypothetical protein